jgi:hypothetical protein
MEGEDEEKENINVIYAKTGSKSKTIYIGRM